MKRYAVLVGMLFVSVGCNAPKQGKAEFFVTRLGNDTLAVESCRVDANSIQGECAVRSPKTSLLRYSMTLNKDGLPESFSYKVGPADGGNQIARDVRYYDDSLVVVTTQDGSSKSATVRLPGRPFPFFANVFGMWDYALHQALGSQPAGELVLYAGTHAMKYEIERTAPGTFTLMNKDHDFGPLSATVDSADALVKLDLTATTDKYVAERAGALDVESLANDFAARERAGQGLGVLSPRDTVRATLANATISVDYGRPEMRGRTIFGNVVPWNQVWRLGANAATQLTTNKKITFGRTLVEPGTYTLFALPSEKGWKLIINYQHGQWGTVYNPSKDLARLAMRTQRLKDPVERFTVGISGHGRSGTLSFKWENTEESIPFIVR